MPNPGRSGSRPLLCYIFVFLVFLPGELYASIEGVRLEPYRVFLLLSCLYLAPTMLRYRYGSAEAALGLYSLWVILSMILVHGGAGVEAGVINFLEVMVSYFIGLSVAADSQRLRRVISLIMLLFTLLTPFAIIETIDGHRLFHVLAGQLAGVPYVDYLGDSYYRYGLHRASTVFSHPILYSVTAVLFLALLPRLFHGGRRLAYIGSVLVAVVTSVTSAAVLMVLWGLFMNLLRSLSRYFRPVFSVAVVGVLLVILVLSIGSNRGPIQVLISSMTFNSETAYTRYLQWQFAADDIAAHPVIGIGFNEWSRPWWLGNSVDSYWLNTVLQNGYPAVLLLALFFILSLRAYWREYRRTSEVLFFSFFVSVTAFVLAAFTVDYFDRAHMMLYLTMGLYNSFVFDPAREQHARA